MKIVAQVPAWLLKADLDCLKGYLIVHLMYSYCTYNVCTVYV